VGERSAGQPGARAALQGQVAWVTGGGTGIGLAAAAAIGSEGARIALSGRRPRELSDGAAKLRERGIEALAVSADVADAESVATAHAQIADALGPVAALVCCAGTNVPNRMWPALTPQAFAHVVAINLNGVSYCVQAVLPGMRAAGAGAIVVVSSWAGWEYLSFAGAAYGASKTALSPLVKSLNDQEGQHGIRACHLCPGEVATPILRTRPVPPPPQDLERMLTPEDVGEAIRWVVAAPAHVCVNELVISPTWNRIYVGAPDLQRR